jgi:hypothetical protein
MLAWPTGATNAVIGDPITVAVAGAPSARRWKTRVVAGFASRQSYSEMQYPNSSMCIRKPLSAVRTFGVSPRHLHNYLSGEREWVRPSHWLCGSGPDLSTPAGMSASPQVEPLATVDA